jgi:hypothetical protein
MITTGEVIRGMKMNRLPWLLVLISVIALLVGCGPSTTGNLQAERAAIASPAATPSDRFTTQDVQRITPAEASSLVDSGEAVLYDVRSAEAYRALHAAGAVSWPEAAAAARFGELQTDKTLIFY